MLILAHSTLAVGYCKWQTVSVTDPSMWPFLQETCKEIEGNSSQRVNHRSRVFIKIGTSTTKPRHSCIRCKWWANATIYRFYFNTTCKFDWILDLFRAECGNAAGLSASNHKMSLCTASVSFIPTKLESTWTPSKWKSRVTNTSSHAHRKKDRLDHYAVSR